MWTAYFIQGDELVPQHDLFDAQTAARYLEKRAYNKSGCEPLSIVHESSKLEIKHPLAGGALRSWYRILSDGFFPHKVVDVLYFEDQDGDGRKIGVGTFNPEDPSEPFVLNLDAKAGAPTYEATAVVQLVSDNDVLHIRYTTPLVESSDEDLPKE